MRSSKANLILGILWSGLWIYHFFQLLSEGRGLEAIWELVIVLPIGAALIMDWILFRGSEAGNFLEQKGWNLPDYLFFLTGVNGVLAFFFVILFAGGLRDIGIMGGIALLISVMHYMRRDLRMRSRL